MDFLLNLLTPTNIGYIYAGIIALFVLSGVIWGLIRGLRKTAIRGVWLFLTALVLLFASGALSGVLLNADLSFIPPLKNVSVDGVMFETSIAKFINDIVISKSGIESSAENLSAITALTELVRIVLNLIVFELLFFLLKYLLLPFNALVAKFIKSKKQRRYEKNKKMLKKSNKELSKKNKSKNAETAAATTTEVPVENSGVLLTPPSQKPIEETTATPTAPQATYLNKPKKYRWWGALCGMAVGLMIVVIMLTPISGIFQVVKLAENQTKGMIDEQPDKGYISYYAGDYYDMVNEVMEESIGAKMFRYTGSEWVADKIFGQLTSVSIGGRIIYLKDDINQIIATASAGLEIYNDYQAIASGGTYTQENVDDLLTKADGLIDSMFKINLFKAIGTQALPIIKSYLPELKNEDNADLIDVAISAISGLQSGDIETLKTDLKDIVSSVKLLNEDIIDAETNLSTNTSILTRILSGDTSNPVSLLNYLTEAKANTIVSTILEMNIGKYILPEGTNMLLKMVAENFEVAYDSEVGLAHLKSKTDLQQAIVALTSEALKIAFDLDIANNNYNITARAIRSAGKIVDNLKSNVVNATTYTNIITKVEDFVAEFVADIVPEQLTKSSNAIVASISQISNWTQEFDKFATIYENAYGDMENATIPIKDNGSIDVENINLIAIGAKLDILKSTQLFSNPYTEADDLTSDIYNKTITNLDLLMLEGFGYIKDFLYSTTGTPDTTNINYKLSQLVKNDVVTNDSVYKNVLTKVTATANNSINWTQEFEVINNAFSLFQTEIYPNLNDITSLIDNEQLFVDLGRALDKTEGNQKGVSGVQSSSVLLKDLTDNVADIGIDFASDFAGEFINDFDSSGEDIKTSVQTFDGYWEDEFVHIQKFATIDFGSIKDNLEYFGEIVDSITNIGQTSSKIFTNQFIAKAVYNLTSGTAPTLDVKLGGETPSELETQVNTVIDKILLDEDGATIYDNNSRLANNSNSYTLVGEGLVFAYENIFKELGTFDINNQLIYNNSLYTFKTESGVNYVKFETFSSPEMTDSTAKVIYNEVEHNILKRFSFNGKSYAIVLIDSVYKMFSKTGSAEFAFDLDLISDDGKLLYQTEKVNMVLTSALDSLTVYKMVTGWSPVEAGKVVLHYTTHKVDVVEDVITLSKQVNFWANEMSFINTFINDIDFVNITAETANQTGIALDNIVNNQPAIKNSKIILGADIDDIVGKFVADYNTTAFGTMQAAIDNAILGPEVGGMRSGGIANNIKSHLVTSWQKELSKIFALVEIDFNVSTDAKIKETLNSIGSIIDNISFNYIEDELNPTQHIGNDALNSQIVTRDIINNLIAEMFDFAKFSGTTLSTFETSVNTLVDDIKNNITTLTPAQMNDWQFVWSEEFANLSKLLGAKDSDIKLGYLALDGHGLYYNNPLAFTAIYGNENATANLGLGIDMDAIFNSTTPSRIINKASFNTMLASLIEDNASSLGGQYQSILTTISNRLSSTSTNNITSYDNEFRCIQYLKDLGTLVSNPNNITTAQLKTIGNYFDDVRATNSVLTFDSGSLIIENVFLTYSQGSSFSDMTDIETDINSAITSFNTTYVDDVATLGTDAFTDNINANIAGINYTDHNYASQYEELGKLKDTFTSLISSCLDSNFQFENSLTLKDDLIDKQDVVYTISNGIEKLQNNFMFGTKNAKYLALYTINKVINGMQANSWSQLVANTVDYDNLFSDYLIRRLDDNQNRFVQIATPSTRDGYNGYYLQSGSYPDFTYTLIDESTIGITAGATVCFELGNSATEVYWDSTLYIQESPTPATRNDYNGKYLRTGNGTVEQPYEFTLITSTTTGITAGTTLCFSLADKSSATPYNYGLIVTLQAYINSIT